ncbi:twin-arginine translocase TatA/TatE family subunit [Microbulbifer echini]|uniref:Sec-independent protein translocase protein TatA n=1 Tax=Microbulbifer echini TaxID=1529067 RepID=A0ABV4NQS1_9GAMM
MGISGVSIWQILIILGLALLLFGSDKIRRMGEDLGGAISGFRRSLRECDQATSTAGFQGDLSGNLIQSGERAGEQE